jgi:nucleotide-binding universal stress UspA family protein
VDRSQRDGNGCYGQAEAYLRRRCDALQTKGLTAEFEVAFGTPTECILAEAETVDLTVMTSGASRWLVGSVLDDVLGEMRQPVVIVRGVPGHTPPPPSLSNVLVPLDMGPYSLHVLPVAQKVATALQTSVILCHIVAPMGQHRDPTDAPPGVARIIQQELDEARRLVTSAAEKVESEGVSAEIVVTMGDAPKEIIRIARGSDAGLIAMATRGRDRLEKRIVGSVANIVVESTDLPCLLARPDNAH